MKLTRKDFLKLLGAAPLVGLAKYMPVEKGGTLKAWDEPLFFHAGGKPEAAADIDMTMVANRSFGDIAIVDDGVAVFDGKRLRYLAVTTEKP